MNNKIGYKDSAIIYNLNDEIIQTIKCKQNSKRVVTSSFMGSGKLSTSQTLEIATKDILSPKVKASQCRCKYKGDIYLIAGIFGHDAAPIRNKNRSVKEKILALQ